MKAFRNIINRFYLDANTRRFIRHNKKVYRRAKPAAGAPVVLVDLHDNATIVSRYSLVATYLAEQTGSRLEYFRLHNYRLDALGFQHFRLDRIFRSFGARPGIVFSKMAAPFRDEARRWAADVFSGLKTKQDVINLTIEGLYVGDLIYDTYLRELRYTVDLKHERLKEILEYAYEVFQVNKAYLARNKVTAIFTTHDVYIQYGILIRLAGEAGIPLFKVCQSHAGIIEISKQNFYQNSPYYLYKEIFKSLPDKDRRWAEGKRLIEERLAGSIESISYVAVGSSHVQSGWGRSSNERILKLGNKPKILVMLHCFFDAPHGYRNMLFPDFWEWVNFTLQEAEKTDFDWYVKPHPAAWIENDAIVKKLEEMYPKVTFLKRTESNSQIAAEGLTAMFTGHGTAGHEFAYMGIPVVNAGDNPHVAYNFNLHPKSIEEYRALIHKAGQLSCDLSKRDIEEYVYMHYSYAAEQNREFEHPEFVRFLATQCNGDAADTKVYGFFTREKISAALKRHFDKFMKLRPLG